MADEGPARWTHRPTRSGRGVAREELQRRQEALARAPLFREIPKRHLRTIAGVTAIGRYRPGRVLVREGASGSEFFVILEGKVRVVRGDRDLAALGPGDFFGEISLLDGGPRTATVIADEPTACLTLAGQDFRDVLAREPSLSARVLRELARRLRHEESPLVG